MDRLALALCFFLGTVVVYAGELVPGHKADDQPRIAAVPEPTPYVSILSGTGAIRNIRRLSNAISHTRLDSGRHAYTVSGIYLPESGMTREQLEEVYRDGGVTQLVCPDRFDWKFDLDKKTCTFEVGRELRLSELAEIIDNSAWFGGHLPYWEELECRDIPKSDRFSDHRYSVAEIHAVPLPSHSDWVDLSTERKNSMPISIAKDLEGTLRITASTAHCMAESRFALRILDENGKVLWVDDTTLYGSFRVALTDLNSDGVQEILLHRTSHSQDAFFLIRPAAKPSDRPKQWERSH
jgi:hypothetical protein